MVAQRVEYCHLTLLMVNLTYKKPIYKFGFSVSNVLVTTDLRLTLIDGQVSYFSADVKEGEFLPLIVLGAKKRHTLLLKFGSSQ